MVGAIGVDLLSTALGPFPFPVAASRPSRWAFVLRATFVKKD